MERYALPNAADDVARVMMTWPSRCVGLLGYKTRTHAHRARLRNAMLYSVWFLRRIVSSIGVSEWP